MPMTKSVYANAANRYQGYHVINVEIHQLLKIGTLHYMLRMSSISNKSHYISNSTYI